MSQRLRLALWLGFAFANLGLALFALLPLENVIPAEVAVLVAASVAFLLTTVNLFHPTRWSGYGYLLTGATSLYTIAAFYTTVDRDILNEFWVPPSTMTLASFAALGFAVHLLLEEDGPDA